MLRLLSCTLLYTALTNAQTTYGTTPLPTPTTVPSLAPTPYPFGPATGPFAPGFNDPRYNNLGNKNLGYNNPAYKNLEYNNPAYKNFGYNNPGYNNPYYNPAAGPAIPIVSYSSEHVGDGTYSFSFTTADGKQVQENGFLKDAYIDNAGEPQGTQVVQGSYAYVSPEGTPIQVSYVADENGFRPSGVHIPADGKPIAPLPPFVPLDARKDQLLDPYNRYDPYNYRNRYNNNLYNRFDPRTPYGPLDKNLYNRYDPRTPYGPHSNNLYNRFDPRIPYDPRYNNQYNPYRPRPIGYDKDPKSVLKKETK